MSRFGSQVQAPRPARGSRNASPILAPARVRLYSTPMRHLIIILLLVSTVSLPSQPVTPDRGSRPRVLFLASYHSSFPTFLSQVDGVRVVFSPLDASMDIEAMDAKRFPLEADIAAFRATLSAKLDRLPAYDVVLLGDDHALRFYLADRSLFGDAFAVFFGVNDRALAASLGGDPGMAGVVEDVSARETLELMARLNPGLTRVWLITDDTPAGVADAGLVARIAADPSGPSVQSLDLSTMTLEELEATLRTLDPAREAALLLSAAGDSSGRRYDFYDSLARICAASSVPVYHLWEHGMGFGLVGGKLVSQRVQARMAASLAMDRVRGASGSAGRVVMESPNTWILDESAMRRFGLSERAIPKGAAIIGGSPDYLVRYGPFAAAILAELAFIILLLWNGIKRKKAQDSLRLALEEKGILLREIHHRVKNNLAVISALLRLQENELSDARARDALVTSRSRIQSMAVLHNELYQEGSCARVSLRRFLDSVVGSVRSLYGKDGISVGVGVEPDDATLCIDDLMTVGLIVNEALVNSYKYAAAPTDNRGRIRIDARIDGSVADIGIADDGPGFPPNVLGNSCDHGLGTQLMRELATQLRGSIEFLNQDGATVRLRFPISIIGPQGIVKPPLAAG